MTVLHIIMRLTKSQKRVRNTYLRLGHSWRWCLEAPRRLLGYFRIIQLLVLGNVTVEFSIACYLFTKWLARNRSKGLLHMSLYLKAASVVLMRWYGEGPNSLGRPPFYPFPISLSRSGLPTIIPAFHRHIIRKRDHRAAKVVKLYLSLFSVYRLIRIPKRKWNLWSNIVDQRKTLNSNSFTFFVKDFGDRVVSLFKRYVPTFEKLPVITGWRWKPMWTASCVASYYVPSKHSLAFTRLLWEWYSVALFDAAHLLEVRGVLVNLDHKVLWPFSREARDWSFWWMLPLFTFFFFPRVIYPLEEDPYSESFCWEMHHRVPQECIYTQAARVFTGLLVDTMRVCNARFRPPYDQYTAAEKLAFYPPGRLCTKVEGGGKTRVFAVTNTIKQTFLRPVHDWCMEVLSKIPMDGTYDQTAPLGRLSGTVFRSFDLTAATDRFPIDLQYAMVERLFNRTMAHAWVVSGLGTNAFKTKPSEQPHLAGPDLTVRFEVGQPLGLLSSWPLFSLCHHALVWYSAEMVGYRSPYNFRAYALLGDDIVFADSAVAEVYRHNLATLGVTISDSKSLKSNIGCYEFAKRFITPQGDLSPVSIRAVLESRTLAAKAETVRKYGGSKQTLLRWSGAGYRRYNTTSPLSLRKLKRWRDVVLTALYHELPLRIWLNFTGIRLTPEREGRIRYLLVQSAQPDKRWDRTLQEEVLSLRDEELWLVEHLGLPILVQDYCKHSLWYSVYSCTYEGDLEDVWRPPFGGRDPRKAVRGAECQRERMKKALRLQLALRIYDLCDMEPPKCLPCRDGDISTYESHLSISEACNLRSRQWVVRPGNSDH